jgi:solute carrier family 13 (sodium-dependent dicarboxylate transporter), member 2/3/5
MEKNSSDIIKRLSGMGGGLLLFVIMLLSSPPEGLVAEGWYTAAIAVLMAVWWTTEVIPIPATAMLPLVLFPLFNISGIGATAAPYANPMIFLFLGGFILAIGMQEWGLHRRIALNIINVIGSKPRSIILGFIISTAFMSMWVSNTAATMMMLPIALSVIQLTKNMEHSSTDTRQYSNFAVALMLAIAYAANVGGLGTVIGTPTNALLIGFMSESYGVEISFMQMDACRYTACVTRAAAYLLFADCHNIPCPVQESSRGKGIYRPGGEKPGKFHEGGDHGCVDLWLYRGSYG